MDDPTRAVRAHRFELLDDDDRLRAVLGPVGRHEGKTLYGLALYDEAGGERALLGVMPSAPTWWGSEASVEADPVRPV